VREHIGGQLKNHRDRVVHGPFGQQQRPKRLDQVAAELQAQCGGRRSAPKLSRIETAAQGIKTSDVNQLCDLYGVPARSPEEVTGGRGHWLISSWRQVRGQRPEGGGGPVMPRSRLAHV
jgi:hypothetical protein